MAGAGERTPGHETTITVAAIQIGADQAEPFCQVIEL